MSGVTVEAVAKHVARVEAQGARAVGVAPSDRTGPVVVAVRISAVQARSRQENTVTIFLTCNIITSLTFLLNPSPSAVIYEFFTFLFGRHTPTATPLNMGYIVIQVKNSLTVYHTVTNVEAEVFGYGVM